MKYSSVLIEYYRTKDKQKSFVYTLSQNYDFSIPSIVKYEVYRGSKDKDTFWEALFAQIEVLAFDSDCASIAAYIYKDMKNNNQLIETNDILIAATAIKYKRRLATLNTKHFIRITQLQLITHNS